MKVRPITVTDPTIGPLVGGRVTRLRRPPGALDGVAAGDLLWLREPFHLHAQWGGTPPSVAAEREGVAHFAADLPAGAVARLGLGGRRAARTLPKALHRYHLQLTAVTLAPIAAITEDEARAEGYASVRAWAAAWDRSMADFGRGRRFAANPAVLVLDFRLQRCPACVRELRPMTDLAVLRREAIVAAYRAGRTQAAIATEFRLSRQRIHQIIRGSGPPQAAAETATGAHLVEQIEAEAARRGTTPTGLAAALSPNPARYLSQLAIARQPKPATIARVRALLAGDPVAAPSVDARAAAGAGRGPTPEIDREPRGYRTVEPRAPTPASDPVDRDPCFRCGTRADIGCRHRPRAGLA